MKESSIKMRLVLARVIFLFALISSLLAFMTGCMQEKNDTSSKKPTTNIEPSVTYLPTPTVTVEAVPTVSIEEFDTLQKVFCLIAKPEVTREEVLRIVEENELYCLDYGNGSLGIGYEYKNVTARGRDREGEGIFVSFSNKKNDAIIRGVSYPSDAGTIVSFSGTTYHVQGGKAHFQDGKTVYEFSEDYDDVEKAIQVLLTIYKK